MSNELLSGPRDIWATVEGVPRRYQLVPDGKGSFKVVDPEIKEAYTQAEAEELGIFHGLSPVLAQTTVLRSEFLFEVWRTLGNKERVPWDSLSVEQQEAVDLMSGEDAYFRGALQWWVLRHGKNFVGLYDWVDLEKAITWGEVAYFAYLVFKFKRSLDWRKLDTPYKISIVKEVTQPGRQKVVLNLVQYKSSLFFSEYLMLVKEGKRYLPFPLIGSFEELRNAFPGIKSDWVLREVAREQMRDLLENFFQKQVVAAK